MIVLTEFTITVKTKLISSSTTASTSNQMSADEALARSLAQDEDEALARALQASLIEERDSGDRNHSQQQVFNVISIGSVQLLAKIVTNLVFNSILKKLRLMVIIKT